MLIVRKEREKKKEKQKLQNEREKLKKKKKGDYNTYYKPLPYELMEKKSWVIY